MKKIAFQTIDRVRKACTTPAPFAQRALRGVAARARRLATFVCAVARRYSTPPIILRQHYGDFAPLGAGCHLHNWSGFGFGGTHVTALRRAHFADGDNKALAKAVEQRYQSRGSQAHALFVLLRRVDGLRKTRTTAAGTQDNR